MPPSPGGVDGRTRLTKLKPKGANGKLTSSSSSSALQSTEIDWKVFGLNLDPPPGGNAGVISSTKMGPSPPMGPRPGGFGSPASTVSPLNARSRSHSGVKLESLDPSRAKTPPFDAPDLSHLKSSMKRSQGYLSNLPPLAALLEERGVDFSRPNANRDVQLPLEAFEDSTMCTRTPEEWHHLMKDPETGLSPLSCRALKLQEDGSGRWQKAMVTSWDRETQRYVIKWSNGTEDKVINSYVLIDGDDPVLFADRLVKALQQRRYANSLLKYHFFINCMPEDRSRKIDKDSVVKIATMAKEGIRDPNNEFADKLNQKLEALVEEAQKEYVRVQNAITFDKVQGQGSLGVLPLDLQFPPPPPAPAVPYLAVKVLPTWTPNGTS